MAQVTPNKTEIKGILISRTPHPALPDFELIDLAVNHTSPVEGFSNLLHDIANTKVCLAVRKDALPDATTPGTAVHGRAYIGGPDAMLIEPVPESQTITDP